MPKHTRHNPANERIKREYFTYLKEANRQSEASVDLATTHCSFLPPAMGARSARCPKRTRMCCLTVAMRSERWLRR